MPCESGAAASFPFSDRLHTADCGAHGYNRNKDLAERGRGSHTCFMRQRLTRQAQYPKRSRVAAVIQVSCPQRHVIRRSPRTRGRSGRGRSAETRTGGAHLVSRVGVVLLVGELHRRWFCPSRHHEQRASRFHGPRLDETAETVAHSYKILSFSFFGAPQKEAVVDWRRMGSPHSSG